MAKMKDNGVSQVDSKRRVERSAIAVGLGRPPRHVVKSFDRVALRPEGTIPSSIEILLVPQRVVAVTVHAPVVEGRGFPIPIGFLSFEPTVVRRAHRYLETELPRQLSSHASAEFLDIQPWIQWEPRNPAVSTVEKVDEGKVDENSGQ